MAYNNFSCFPCLIHVPLIILWKLEFLKVETKILFYFIFFKRESLKVKEKQVLEIVTGARHADIYFLSEVKLNFSQEIKWTTQAKVSNSYLPGENFTVACL